MSANPSAQPRPTGDIRPISGGSGTDRPAPHGHVCRHSYRFALCCRKTCGTPRPGREGPERGSGRTRRSPRDPHEQREPQQLHARSGRRSPPPGPVRRLRGMRRRCSPSPPRPVQRADPRSTHASAPAGTGPERTAGRTATHQEHAPTPRTRAPPRLPEAVRAGRRKHPGARVLAGRRATVEPAPPLPAHSRAPVHSLGRFLRAPPRRSPRGGTEGLHRPSPAPPRPLRGSSALPSRDVRLPLARPATSVTRAARLPAVPRAWPVRTTIPPYGRPALNGRDAANYAGFTDVLSRAAYSSGLGQMRVRPECRGSSLGRTRYECRAPHR